MAAPQSYVLCGTPRTGSTLLCDLLSSTGVLGRPESYFREPDEAVWAARFGVAVDDGGAAQDYRAFAAAARAAGSTGNGVFGVRVMWGSLERVIAGLAHPGDRSDRAVLERAFGPLAFLLLHRVDVVAQAVSWCRAEQTGYWQPGDRASGPPVPDVDRARALAGEIRAHNAAWRAWFAAQAIDPYVLSHERLVADQHGAVAAVAERLGVELPPTWRPASRHRKQADEISAAWVDALRADPGRGP